MEGVWLCVELHGGVWFWADLNRGGGGLGGAVLSVSFLPQDPRAKVLSVSHQALINNSI